MSGRRGAPVVALALAALPGCFWFTTKHEGQVLDGRVENLEGRMARQEESVDEKVTKLDESLERATKLLARNSADLGSDVQKLYETVAKLTGDVELLRRELATAREENAKLRSDYEARLAAAQARLDAVEKAAAKPVPAPLPDKDALYDGAYQKYLGGQDEEARRDLRLFVQKFPKDARASNAQFYLGETFYRNKEYERAIQEYQKVIDAYPSSDFADDAFLQAGNAAMHMKWCTDARAYFGVLMQRYPTSPLAKAAKKKLDYLKKNAKKKKICAS